MTHQIYKKGLNGLTNSTHLWHEVKLMQKYSVFLKKSHTMQVANPAWSQKGGGIEPTPLIPIEFFSYVKYFYHLQKGEIIYKV